MYVKGPSYNHSVTVQYDTACLAHTRSSDAAETSKAILPWFQRLHSLVIGPGLGREPAVLESVKVLISEARRMEKVMLVDADGLFLVTSEPSVVQGYRGVILTPNEAEFGRLYHKVVGIYMTLCLYTIKL